MTDRNGLLSTAILTTPEFLVVVAFLLAIPIWFLTWMPFDITAN